MGLDISYYKNLILIDCAFNADGDPLDPDTQQPMDWGDYVQVHINSEFLERADELKDQGVYRYESSGRFRAGSYSGYNQWREELAKLAGYPKTPYERFGETYQRHDAGAWAATHGPFWELINFSDCEGVIGPITSGKLAQDFAEFEARAKPPTTGPQAWFARENNYFFEKYQEWQTAFETAAQNGCVEFH